MQYLMRLVVLLCLFGLSLAEAKPPPPTVLLKVTKNEATEIKSRFRSSSYERRTGVDVLTYSIQVINSTQAEIKNMQIRWAILLRGGISSSQKLVEGTNTATLAKLEKFQMDTVPVEMREFWHSSISNRNSDKMEEVGHLVEVIVDGKTIASEIKPMDVKQKIEAARRAGASTRPKEEHLPQKKSGK